MKTTITQQQVYDLAMESFGVVPGIIKEIAERSLPVAYLYTSGTAILENGSFDQLSMNAIELKISVLNHCASCSKGHSFLLKQTGLDAASIQAITEGRPTGNDALDQLLQATEYIYYAGNDEYPDYVVQYLQDHFTEQQILDIIGLIALKVVSNYTNNYLVTARKMVRSEE